MQLSRILRMIIFKEISQVLVQKLTTRMYVLILTLPSSGIWQLWVNVLKQESDVDSCRSWVIKKILPLICWSTYTTCVYDMAVFWHVLCLAFFDQTVMFFSCWRKGEVFPQWLVHDSSVFVSWCHSHYLHSWWLFQYSIQFNSILYSHYTRYLHKCT